MYFINPCMYSFTSESFEIILGVLLLTNILNSSPVVIKLGAFCVAVDVVVDKSNLFIVFFVGMSTTKLRSRLL